MTCVCVCVKVKKSVWTDGNEGERKWGDLSWPVSWLPQLSAGDQHVFSSAWPKDVCTPSCPSSLSPPFSSITGCPLDPSSPSACKHESPDTRTSLFTPQPLLTAFFLSISPSSSFTDSDPFCLYHSLICFLVHLANMSCGKTTDKQWEKCVGEYVCVLCGGSCAHLHVCAYAQMTRATVRLFLRQINPFWKCFHMSI